MPSFRPPLWALRAAIVSFWRDEAAPRFWPDGILLIDNGHVAAIGDHSELAPKLPAEVRVEHFPDLLIAPGFVDAHVHFPQIDRIGAHGAQLLDWLERYIYPAEARLSDGDFAKDLAKFFVAELLRHGITTALVFAASQKQSADSLFAAARAKDMRLIGGQVLMDRGAPDEVLVPAEIAAEQSSALIRKWHGKGRLGYAITPRFAVTSSDRQLELAGKLHSRFPDTLVHTHLSENPREVALVRELFPDHRDYFDVYARHGLAGPRSVFAHCVHLSDGEWRDLAKAGSAIAFCPGSNLFLGSGLFDHSRARRMGIRVGLGSDVGAGDSLSPFAAQKDAYRVGQMRGDNLHPFDAFRMATLGGAEALGLDHLIGGLEPGKEADFVLIDRAATPLLARRLRSVADKSWSADLADTFKSWSADLADTLFALSILGEDRMIARTYVAGRLVHRRASPRRRLPPL